MAAEILFDEDARWDPDDDVLYQWAFDGTERIRCEVNPIVINAIPRFRYASIREMLRHRSEIMAELQPIFARLVVDHEVSSANGFSRTRLLPRHMARSRSDDTRTVMSGSA
jgi:hypothetical protein